MIARFSSSWFIPFPTASHDTKIRILWILRRLWIVGWHKRFERAPRVQLAGWHTIKSIMQGLKWNAEIVRCTRSSVFKRVIIYTLCKMVIARTETCNSVAFFRARKLSWEKETRLGLTILFNGPSCVTYGDIAVNVFIFAPRGMRPSHRYSTWIFNYKIDGCKQRLSKWELRPFPRCRGNNKKKNGRG